MLDINTAIITLRSAGVRMTPQRLLILEALAGNRSHPTVEQLYEYVRQRYPTVSLATVYQTTALLARHHLIVELHGDRGVQHCDPDMSPHAHAYCRQCGSIMDVEIPASCTWHPVHIEDFHPMQLEISIYGFCGECQTLHRSYVPRPSD